jgi:flagellar basal body-associated protein FliL
VETLKNLQQLQKLNAEMTIGELERENENLRAKVTSLQIQIATLPHPVIVHGEEGGGNSKTETKQGTPVPIVEEGKFIVVNPADSTRYLMVEILLIRKNADDNEFPGVVKENRKRLEAQVSNVLSALSAEEAAELSVRNGMPNQLKKLFQTILGSSHPIDKVIIPKWVMQ